MANYNIKWIAVIVVVIVYGYLHFQKNKVLGGCMKGRRFDVKAFLKIANIKNKFWLICLTDMLLYKPKISKM